MSSLVRFGVSVERKLLKRFDSLIQSKNYFNRSEAIRDLIRENLVKEEWVSQGEVTGAISLVYNPHKRELVNKVTDIQHRYHSIILSTQHIHLDRNNCLEIVVIKGEAKEAQKLLFIFKSIKGIKHATLTMTTTGKKI